MITCEFEDGGKGKLRHVTANAVIVKDGKILLGKRGTFNGKPLTEYGKWSLIGGFVGRDENLIQAIQREIKEETGLEVTNITLIHIKDNPDRAKEDRQNIEFVYAAELVGEIGESDEEVTELRWIPLNNISVEVAFDHQNDIRIYNDYIAGKIHIPVMGKYE